jgi:manganese/zinc/iron transport system permease protein
MPELMRDLFFDYTIRNVALGAAILGLLGGALGSFAVLRRQGLLGDALAHASLPGVCVAFMLSGSKAPVVLLLGAGLSAWLGALLILAIVRGTRIKQDAALGIVLSVFFGAGVVLLTHIASSGDAGQSGLDRFVFGQASTIVRGDVITMGVLAAVALLVTALFFKEFKLVSFDPAFAAGLGFPVRGLNVLLTTLIVVAVVVGIQAVGVVLMAAMLITPASAARQWTDDLGTMIVLSALFGASSGVGGTLLSAAGSNLPTGPLIVLCATTILLVSLALGRRHGSLWNRLRGRRNRREALGSAAPAPQKGGGAV